MESRRKPQLLVYLTLFSVLFSQTLAWPLFEEPFLRTPLEGANELDQGLLTQAADISPGALAANDRNARQAEEVFTTDYKRILGQLPAKRHVDSFIEKRDSNNISEDNGTTKRDVGEKLKDRKAHLEQQANLRVLLEKLRNSDSAQSSA